MSEEDRKRLAHLKSFRCTTAAQEQEIKLLEARITGTTKNFKPGDLVSVRMPFGTRYGRIVEVYEDGTADMTFHGFFGDDPSRFKSPAYNVPMGNMRKWNGVLPKNLR